MQLEEQSNTSVWNYSSYLLLQNQLPNVAAYNGKDVSPHSFRGAGVRSSSGGRPGGTQDAVIFRLRDGRTRLQVTPVIIDRPQFTTDWAGGYSFSPLGPVHKAADNMGLCFPESKR